MHKSTQTGEGETRGSDRHGGKDNNTGKKGGCQDQNHDMLPLTSLPTSGQCKVWQPNALTSIIPGHALSLRCAFGMMKTRFRSIFLKALEVHHTFVLQVTHQDSLFIHLFIYLSIEAEKIKIMSIYCFSFPAITACAILHNICLWGGAGWRLPVVLHGGTGCLWRCLPWRRLTMTTTICSRHVT